MNFKWNSVAHFDKLSHFLLDQHLISLLSLYSGCQRLDWGLINLNHVLRDFPGGSGVKTLSVSAGGTRDVGLIPGSGGSLGGGNDNRGEYSCWENSMDRVALSLPSMGSQRMGHDWVHTYHALSVSTGSLPVSFLYSSQVCQGGFNTKGVVMDRNCGVECWEVGCYSANDSSSWSWVNSCEFLRTQMSYHLPPQNS